LKRAFAWLAIAEGVFQCFWVNTLQDRTALVTGSSRGIGATIARKLALQGAEVLIHGSRDTDTLRRVVEEIRAKGGKAEFLVADMREPGSMVELFDRLGTHAEQLDILINNAGIFGGGALESLELETIQRVLTVNVTSLTVATREFVRRTKSSSGNSVAELVRRNADHTKRREGAPLDLLFDLFHS
jgi:3-oxoacyl-[acyl-carrier protein] reductase